MHDTKIEMKIHEEIKPFEEVCKKMIEEFSSSIDSAEEKHLPQAGMITDMIKDLCEAKEKIVKACYYKYILCAMEREDEEEKEDEKRLLKMLKEEHGDEYKRMREEYGEEEADRRFYDNWRHSDGRFARKGTGSYRPRSSGRRGYEEPPYLHMPLDFRMDMEDYAAYPPEYWRDVDRQKMNRMYYTDGGSMGNPSGGSYGGNSGGNGGQSGNMGGNSGGNVRGYSDGYNDGYREGERNGKGSESRYDRARRGYEETKQNHKGNTPEDHQLTMKEMEKVLNVVFDEIDDMLQDAPAEMKNMVKSKGMSRMQKIQ